MERLIIITIHRLLGSCSDIIETENGVMVTELNEVTGIKTLNDLCEDSGLVHTQLSDNSYFVSLN